MSALFRRDTMLVRLEDNRELVLRFIVGNMGSKDGCFLYT